MSLVIAFSTRNEAQALIDNIEHKQINETTFACSFGYILISGIGSFATLHSLYNFPYKIDELWNLGIAGSLNTNAKPGTLFEVQQVGRLMPTLSETSQHGIYVFSHLYPTVSCMQSPDATYRLLTTEYPLFHREVRETLQNDWDLVDMEGYAFASFASKHDIPLKLWKGVSDDAVESGEFSIVEAIPKVSKQLAEQVFATI